MRIIDLNEIFTVTQKMWLLIPIRKNSRRTQRIMIIARVPATNIYKSPKSLFAELRNHFEIIAETYQIYINSITNKVI